MKKFLSLVLSLVMAMSLVTVSASATDDEGFTDASDINYKEAVDVMSGIGIISGYRDDSFRPDGALTRGAAAKIIAYLNLGTKTGDALSCQNAPYKDVKPSDTFAPYIAYVKNAKICDGYSDGTFRAGAPLTGFAFNKMLLTSLGYDSKSEGFVGPNWSVAVAKRAVKIGLTDGNDDFTGLDTCTREEACLYALNTLQATEVEYDNMGTSININGAEIVTGASAAEKVTTNDKDGRNIDDDKNGDNDYYLEFAEDHFDDLELKDATDDFGADANKWVYKDKDIGTYADDADYEFTTTADGDTVKEKLEDMDLDEYKMDDDAVWYVNGDSHSHNFANSSKELKDLTDDGEAGDQLVDLLGKGRLVKVYTDDQTVEKVVVIDTYLAEITSISSASDKVTLKAKKDHVNIDKVDDDNDFYAQLSDMDEDDLVLVTLADKEVKSVAIPETETGTISKISSSKNNENVRVCDGLTFDGTKYKLSAQSSDFTTEMEIKADDDSKLYLDTYGFAIWIDDVNENNDYVTAIDSYQSLVDGKLVTVVQGYDMKGNEVTLNVGTKNRNVDLDGTVYNYVSDDENDADYRLEGESDNNKIQSFTTSASKPMKASTVKVEGKYFDSDVLFLFIEDGDDMDDVTVETDCQNVDNGTKVQYVLDDDDHVTAVVIKAESDTATGDDVAYVTEQTGTTEVDDKDAYQYTVYIEGDEVIDVISKDDIDDDTFVTYAKNSDGTYKLKEYEKSTDKTSVVLNATIETIPDANKDIMSLDESTPYSGTDLNDLDCSDAVIVDLRDADDEIGNMDDMYDMWHEEDDVYVSIVFNNKNDDDEQGEVSYIFVNDVDYKNGSSSGSHDDDDTPDTPDGVVKGDKTTINYDKLKVYVDPASSEVMLVNAQKALIAEGYKIKTATGTSITATKDGIDTPFTVEAGYVMKVDGKIIGGVYEDNTTNVDLAAALKGAGSGYLKANGSTYVEYPAHGVKVEVAPVNTVDHNNYVTGYVQIAAQNKVNTSETLAETLTNTDNIVVKAGTTIYAQGEDNPTTDVLTSDAVTLGSPNDHNVYSFVAKKSVAANVIKASAKYTVTADENYDIANLIKFSNDTNSDAVLDLGDVTLTVDDNSVAAGEAYTAVKGSEIVATIEIKGVTPGATDVKLLAADLTGTDNGKVDITDYKSDAHVDAADSSKSVVFGANFNHDSGTVTFTWTVSGDVTLPAMKDDTTFMITASHA